MVSRILQTRENHVKNLAVRKIREFGIFLLYHHQKAAMKRELQDEFSRKEAKIRFK